jgi:hypothetical protein
MEHRCAVESDYHHLTRPLHAQLRELDGPEPPSATPANARDIPARSSLHKHRWRCGAITVGPGCGCLSGLSGQWRRVRATCARRWPGGSWICGVVCCGAWGEVGRWGCAVGIAY